MVGDEEKDEKNDAKEIKEILSVVSAQVPSLIKGILASVFSEEAGRSMGKAAAAYYKELKNGGMPEQVAVKMTEDYMKTFTDLGQMIKGMGIGDRSIIGGQREGHEADIGEEITQTLDKRRHEKEKQKGE